MIWVLEFPASMAFALTTACALGPLRRANAVTLVASVGLLLAANVVGTLAFVMLHFFFWELAYLPAMVVNAVLVALAQALLNREVQGSPGATWMRCFARLLWAGIPIGLVVGGLVSYFIGHAYWVIPAIQITWGAMIGISLVASEPDPITSPGG